MDRASLPRWKLLAATVALLAAVLLVPRSAQAAGTMTVILYCKAGWNAEILYRVPQGLSSETWVFSTIFDRWGAPYTQPLEPFVCRSRAGCLIKSFRKGWQTILWDTVWVTSWAGTPYAPAGRCIPPGAY